MKGVALGLALKQAKGNSEIAYSTVHFTTACLRHQCWRALGLLGRIHPGFDLLKVLKTELFY